MFVLTDLIDKNIPKSSMSSKRIKERDKFNFNILIPKISHLKKFDFSS